MGQVTVTINDKIYRIACDDGQEDHLRSLGVELDAKIGDMRKAFGEIGDSRLTVMAAITFLDERDEMRSRLAGLEQRLARLEDERQLLEASLGRTESEIADAISDAAGRIEAVARELAPAPQG